MLSRRDKALWMMLSFIIACYRSEHTIGAVVEELIGVVEQRPEHD